MTINPEGVYEIVGEIWESMLGLEVEGVASSPDAHGRELRSAVQITGGWQGAFIIECPESSGAVFTAAMLGYEDGEDPPQSEVHDVMGELANMAGGNLKAVIGGESRLSLPTVVVGSGLDLNVLGATEVVRSHYVAGGAPFTAVVVARSQ